MRVVVTGALGALGRAVTAQAVAAGHDVLALDRISHDSVDDGATHDVVDLLDRDRLRTAVDGADAVIHLAAHPSPLHHPDVVVHDENVVASYHALETAAAAGVGTVVLASSINAIGGAYSQRPRYDRFPVDETHPGYPEDPYSLSKWIAEQQAAAVVRRQPELRVAALRMHALRERAEMTGPAEHGWRDLWGYSPPAETAAACVAALTADFAGFECGYVVAADTTSDVPSAELARRFYPDVPVVGDLSGHRAFFDSSRARRLFGWTT